MKNKFRLSFFAVTLLLLSNVIVTAQTNSCCSAPDQFAAFAKDAAFVNKHEEPIPFSFIADKGKEITVTCSDGSTAKGYGIPATTTSNKYVFVYHEWWGLNDYIRKMAEQLHTDLGGNVNIIAIDLYDGKVAAVRDSAKAYMSALTTTRAQTIINAFISTTGENAQIATIGWCMGGTYSLQSTLIATQKSVGCIMYYGMPESDTEKLKTLTADVLMIWPNQDKNITKEVVDKFKANMAALGKNLQVEEYNADHAFANPSNPKYNVEAATDAYTKSLAFLKLKLAIS